MKVTIITRNKKQYTLQCDNIIEREKKHTTWLVCKKADKDLARFNVLEVEVIKFI